MSRYLTSDQIAAAIRIYREDPETTTRVLAQKLGVSSVAIANHLRKNIPPEEYRKLKLLRNPTHPGEAEVERRRKAEQARSEAFRNRVNHSAMSGLLTPEKAYWIGFLMADGCLCGKDGARVCLTLQEGDRKHVEKWREFVSGQFYEIRHTASTNSCGLRFMSRQMASDLATYGVLPRKSLTDAFAKSIPEEYLSHYMRGFFEGDGSVHFDSRGGRGEGRTIVQMAGGEEFIRRLLRSMESKGFRGLGPYKKVEGEPVRIAQFQKDNAMGLLDWMYKDSTPETRLDRKFEKFEKLRGRV